MVCFTSKASEVDSQDLWAFILDNQDFVFFWAAQIRRGFSFLKTQGLFTEFCIIFVSMGTDEQSQCQTLSAIFEKSMIQFFKDYNQEYYRRRRVVSIDIIDNISVSFQDLETKIYIKDIGDHFKRSFLFFNGVSSDDFADATAMLDAMLETRSKFNQLCREKYEAIIQKYPKICYDVSGDYHILRNMRDFKNRKYLQKLSPEGHQNL